MKRHHMIVLWAAIAVLTFGSAGMAIAADQAVVEVVTLKLKEGVTPAEFAPVDKAVATAYASKQPGFISREAAAGENGEWLVIVHWRSAQDADASMKNFETAKETQEFMAKIDPASMRMKRYVQQ